MSEVSSINDRGGHEIAVRPDHSLPKTLLASAILVVWGVSGFAFVKALFAEGAHGSLLLLCFLALTWLGMGVAIVLSLLWTLFGTQKVLIQKEDLTVTRGLGPVYFGRPETFALAHIQGMKIEERKYKSRGNATVKCAITFEYLGEKQFLFTYLAAEQAESLMRGPLYRFALHAEVDER